MALDPVMKGAMQQPYFISAYLMEIELPTYSIRILDGSGEIRWGQRTFYGSDPIFGTLAAIDPIQEQIGTEAPLMRMKFLPQSTFSTANITAPINQGSPISIWWAVVDRSTGSVIGEPYLCFSGELDTAEIDIDQTETNVTMDVASVWERLFQNQEGKRLNNANHQRVWAERATSERGFEFVVAIQRNEPWGYDGPRAALVADTIGGQPASGGGNQPGLGNGGGGSVGNGGGGFSGGGSYDMVIRSSV